MAASQIASIESPPAARNAALLAGFIVAAAALHIGFVAASANSIPFSDEWIAIIDDVLRPAATGQLSPWDLFRSHNEHTMVPTRLLALVALWLNHGQFDNVPVALFNALLYSGAMAVPIFLFFRHAPGPTRLFAIVLALALLVPIEGEDLIFGFQNQYYFMIAGTTVLLWLAANSTSTSKPPLAAFAIVGFITCVSMGSGFFAAAVAVFICALRWWREPQHRRALRLRMLVGSALTIFGLVLVLHAFVVMKEVGILGDKHRSRRHSPGVFLPGMAVRRERVAGAAAVGAIRGFRPARVGALRSRRWIGSRSAWACGPARKSALWHSIATLKRRRWRHATCP
jgi:hypothetical protein